MPVEPSFVDESSLEELSPIREQTRLFERPFFKGGGKKLKHDLESL